MNPSTLSKFAIALAVASLLALPTAQAQSKTVTTDTHSFHEVADGVYFVVGTGSIFVQSNSLLIVNEDDAILVDSHVTPDAAKALIKSVKKVTKKPVRYLVNTHYHFDHAHGNQVFPDNIEIIGHEYTRERLLGNVLEQTTAATFTGGIPGQIKGMRGKLASETDPAKKADLEREINVQEAHVKALKEVIPTPPTMTMRDKMTLFRGGREIQLIHLGRGHTGGDIVVFLPEERIVFTGDLMLPMLAYGGDGFVNEWDETLERLKSLPFDVILPGHGDPFTDKGQITNFQAYLRDLWAQVVELKEQGLTADEAIGKLDLDAHKENFPGLSYNGIFELGVRRIYKVIDAQ